MAGELTEASVLLDRRVPKIPESFVCHDQAADAAAPICVRRLMGQQHFQDGQQSRGHFEVVLIAGLMENNEVKPLAAR